MSTAYATPNSLKGGKPTPTKCLPQPRPSDDLLLPACHHFSTQWKRWLCRYAPDFFILGKMLPFSLACGCSRWSEGVLQAPQAHGENAEERRQLLCPHEHFLSAFPPIEWNSVLILILQKGLFPPPSANQPRAECGHNHMPLASPGTSRKVMVQDGFLTSSYVQLLLLPHPRPGLKASVLPLGHTGSHSKVD